MARYPKGLLRLAAQQTEFHNGSIHRRFEQEGELLIHYWEYQVIFAASRVGEWHAKHPEAGRRAPTPVRQRSAEVCDGDEHHILLEELEYAWFRHRPSSLPAALFPILPRDTCRTDCSHALQTDS